MNGLDEDIPYRTAVPLPPDASQASSRDEDNYDTLKLIQKGLVDAIDGLYKDFNAFEVLKDADNRTASQALMRNIAAKQEAYDILVPLLESVNSAVNSVDNKYKKR